MFTHYQIASVCCFLFLFLTTWYVCISGSSVWEVWRSVSWVLKLSCWPPMTRKNGHALPSLWTLRSVVDKSVFIRTEQTCLNVMSSKLAFQRPQFHGIWDDSSEQVCLLAQCVYLNRVSCLLFQTVYMPKPPVPWTLMSDLTRCVGEGM